MRVCLGIITQRVGNLP